MTTTAVRGHLSFGLGTATYGATAGNSPTIDGDSWFTQPFTAATLAVNEFAEMLPQELGATLFTRGGYKSGAFMAGSASMEVRLAKYFGKFLQAMAATGTPTARIAQAPATLTNTASIGALPDRTLVFGTAPSTVLVAGDVITIESEKLLVLKCNDSGTNKNYTVARGYDGTTAVAHTTIVPTFTGTDRFTVFAPTPGSEQAVPLVHARRYVPDTSGGTGYTEYGFDGKAVSLSLAMPQMGAAKAEFGVVLRRPYGIADEDSVTASSINGISDSPLSLALSCTSNIALPTLGISNSTNAAFMGAQVQLVNGTISPQDGMIVGSYHPEDFTVLSRGGTVRMAYKWKDEALYNAVVYGGDLAEWQPQIKYSDVVLSMTAASNATTYPYRLDLVFPNVALTMSTPTLVAGRFVMTEVTGAVTYDSVTGYPWMAFMRNGATYAGV